MQQQRIANLNTKPLPEVCRVVDLYAPEDREVVLMEDAIQVKQQKANREQRHSARVLLGGSPPVAKRPRHRRLLLLRSE